MISNSEIYTIAFYNVENLFDTKNDPLIHDDDFLPNSAKRWTTKRYLNKIMKLSIVISQIGKAQSKLAPAIIGLAEVENKKVLSDLVKSKNLLNENYKYVHYDSLDERGINVALLYNPDVFKVDHSETFSVYLENNKSQQDYTRDILLVKGQLHNENLCILVNHWSSRREGVIETEFKRLAAAKVVNSVISELKNENPDNKIIVMGDFNDNPNDRTMLLLEKRSDLYNPFKTVWSPSNGSLNHNFQWNNFDQILFSTNFFEVTDNALTFYDGEVFNNKFLTQYHGKYQGQPFRTYVGKKYQGGYSDHFPVFIQLKPS
ncbi:endonuclease/exonuclease/phosphatase family protein [Winogradskyella bathintestinalis]|uniref:Endonuclease n=1 Tax=Winogradskyella bathintestinalis TaxID=3035208 RepID=A0ABT7ZR03_9FLAO|nr:endonuclease/exonuclease/phosphatase family protein [Winogradskyella bathintestinalis]MDN3491433.1 endonuclease [Winogradskyella bathintestinalis]